MRDIALAGFISLILLTIFKHPVMGSYLWAWLGLMNPHKLTYGFAFRLPFAQVTAIVTLLALLLTKKKQSVPIGGIVVLELLLLAHMSFTSLFSMASPAEVLDRWIFVMKIHVMLFVTWMLVCDGKQLRWLIWVVTLSV